MGSTGARRAMLTSLVGLSVGDAFGQRFFHPDALERFLPARVPPPGPWPWTDDTNMALSIIEVLLGRQGLDQDALAGSFASRYDPFRGYGPAMHGLLPRIAAGGDWRIEARSLFGGQGSYGNGASMRIAPLGAFFSEDLDRAVTEAGRSAEITHTHPEAVAGAVAVAVAAALAAQGRDGDPPDSSWFLRAVSERTPPSEVRTRLEVARTGPMELAQAVSLLGNGSHISAQDTVPLSLWVAAQLIDDYQAALWMTVQAGGDVDTTCAIVGGVVAARVGLERIPAAWIERREPLPDWVPTP